MSHMPSPRTEWERDMRSLLGKWVIVTLQRDPVFTAQSGELLGFDDAGEVMLRDDMGFVHWCWPNLDCQEMERPGG